MARDTRLSNVCQRSGETNSEFLNRLFEDLMIIEYNGFSLEERRISHFIINALRDPNHRQNAAFQYQHLRQSPNQTFDYWLNIIRTLPLLPQPFHRDSNKSTMQ